MIPKQKFVYIMYNRFFFLSSQTPNEHMVFWLEFFQQKNFLRWVSHLFLIHLNAFDENLVEMFSFPLRNIVCVQLLLFVSLFSFNLSTLTRFYFFFHVLNCLHFESRVYYSNVNLKFDFSWPCRIMKTKREFNIIEFLMTTLMVKYFMENADRFAASISVYV